MLVKNLTKTVDKKEILKEISFVLHSGDKIGLIGQNGCGKSTLLKILASKISYDYGEIIGDELFGYLKQEIPVEDYNLTIFDYVKKESGLFEIEKKMHMLEQNLTEDKLDEYDKLLNQYLNADGYNFETNLNIMLNNLKFDINLNKKISEISGGEKMKVLIVSLLLGIYDILLLDEPTNNLDIESVEFLQEMLIKTQKIVILVSHDEEFLNSITNKIWELKNGNLIEYAYGYKTYLQAKEDKYQRDLQIYNEIAQKQEILSNKINKLEHTMKKTNYSSSDNDKIAKNYKAGRVQSSNGALMRSLKREVENLQPDSNFKLKEQYNFEINFDDEQVNLHLQDLVCGYNNFSTPKITLNITTGDKVLIIGKNGTGKSTLIKTLLKELKPKNGTITISSNAKFGYIEQNSLDNDNENLNLLEYVTKDLKEKNKARIFEVLHNFHISYDDKDKIYKTFSAGERTKINLAKLSLNNVNVLLLDEPTNHLDIDACNILYEALSSFRGIIIAISHNKTFISKFNANIILDMNNGQIKELYNNE